MKRVVLLGIVWMMSAAVTAAQTPSAASAVLESREPLTVSAKAVTFDSGEPALMFFQQTPRTAPQPRPPAPAYRRRPSFVGYLDESTIASKVRVRYDLAYENPTPDRAEFFYAKCGCYKDLDPVLNADIFDPDAPGPRPGTANDINFRELLFLGEYATSDRMSVFAELPIRTVSPEGFIGGGTGFDDATGIGDIRAGVKFGLAGDDMYDFIGQVKAFLPPGDAEDGLGTDHFSLEPAVLYGRQLSERANIETQVGFWIPFGGAAPQRVAQDGHFSSSVFFYGIGPSFDAVRTDKLRLSPVVELVGWSVLGGDASIDNGAGGLDFDEGEDGANIINLKFGARIAWNDRGSFYIGYGKALTDKKWYDDILRFEYRHGF